RGKRCHISTSVKSTAGAISTRPAIEADGAGPAAAARRLSSRASSSAIQPPIDEPTTTCGPRQNASKAAALSSSQRPIVPAARTRDRTVPRLIGSFEYRIAFVANYVETCSDVGSGGGRAGVPQRVGGDRGGGGPRHAHHP